MLGERALPHPAAFVEPCLLRPAKQPPEGRGWIHEIKHDVLADRLRLIMPLYQVFITLLEICDAF